MTTEDAIQRLEALGVAGWYWHVARGKLKPSEPLYGVGLLRPEAQGCFFEIFGEGETLADAVVDLDRKLAVLAKH